MLTTSHFTPAEMALFPHIAACHTQNELNHFLNASDQEDMLAARNLLEKFPYKDFYNALATIREYLQTQLTGNYSDALYCKEASYVTVVDSDQLRQTTNTRSTLLNMLHETTFARTTVTEAVYDILYHAIDGQETSAVHRSGHTEIHEISYPKPIPALTDFTRQTKIIRSMGDGTLKNHLNWFEPIFPTRMAQLSVQFIGKRVPNIVYTKIRGKNGIVHEKAAIFDAIGPNHFQLKVQRPSLETHHCICWEW